MGANCRFAIDKKRNVIDAVNVANSGKAYFAKKSGRRAAAAAKQILENSGRLFHIECRANGVGPTSIADLFAQAIRKPRPGRSQHGVLNIITLLKTGRVSSMSSRL